MTKRVPRRTNIRRVGKSSSRKTRSKKQTVGERAKAKLSSTFVWILVVVNFVLIVSLIHRLVTQFQRPKEIIIEGTDPNIEVLNGTNVNGLAKSFSDYLRSKGFDVVKVDNAESHDYKTTMVIDLKHARPRQNSQAHKLADALGVSRQKVLAMADEESHADVRVILGADYETLKAYEKIR